MFGGFRDEIRVITVAQSDAPVITRHRQHIVVDQTTAAGSNYDFLLIPGGDSALEAAKDPDLLQWIRDTSDQAERVMAVCTGTVLLGMTGLLDGRRATTNKLDFTSTRALGAKGGLGQRSPLGTGRKILYVIGRVGGHGYGPGRSGGHLWDWRRRERWPKAANTNGMTTQAGILSPDRPDWSSGHLGSPRSGPRPTSARRPARTTFVLTWSCSKPVGTVFPKNGARHDITHQKLPGRSQRS